MKHIRLIAPIVLSLALAAQASAAQPDHPEDAAHAAEETVHDVDGTHAAHEGDAHGTQGSVQDINLWQFGTAIVVFLLAFGVLSQTAWPKITKGLSEREGKIRSEIEAAEQARKAANQALRDYEKSLAEARAEAQAMIDQTKAEQVRMAAEQRVKAEAEIAEMRASALSSIDAAKRAAVSDLYAEAAAIATSAASKILQREVNEQDQRRIVEESIAEFTRDYARS